MFKQWLKNPEELNPKTGVLTPIKRKKVKDYLPAEIVNECMNGVCEIDAVKQKTKVDEQIEKQTYVIGYEDVYKSALDNYAQKKYDVAIRIMDSLSKANPNNALLHNDLALFYNQVGNYDEAIKHVYKIVYDIGDKSQYGAAQYNAGVAYERKGELDRALTNYALAFSNGNLDAKEAVSRVKRKMMRQKSKKTAFNTGIQNIKSQQKNQHKDANLFLNNEQNCKNYR